MTDLAQRFSTFRNQIIGEVSGWLAWSAVDLLELCARYQSDAGIKGDALEIGVYHGRFFLALMSALEPKQIALAADIFDDQSLNIDLSGAGAETLRIFKDNVARFAPNPRALKVIAGDSMILRADQIMSHSTSDGFRLISVDGGHTPEHVMNDLDLASRVIVGGGGVFLDDFHSPHWPGVYEGYLRYMMHSNRNLAPVMFAGNKLLLTTIAHQPRMVDYMRQHYSAPEGTSIAEVKSVGFSYLAQS